VKKKRRKKLKAACKTFSPVSSSGGMCVTVPYVPVEIASHESTRARPRSATFAVHPRKSAAGAARGTTVAAAEGGKGEEEEEVGAGVGAEAPAAAFPPLPPPATDDSSTLPPVRSPWSTSSECR
jgi:hypothetical protein